MKNDTLDGFLKALITAPKNKQAEIMHYAADFLRGRAPDKLLLTGAEAARQLSISPQTLWRLRRSGQICPVKIRGSTRYRKTDLDLLAQGSTP